MTQAPRIVGSETYARPASAEGPKRVSGIRKRTELSRKEPHEAEPWREAGQAKDVVMVVVESEMIEEVSYFTVLSLIFCVFWVVMWRGDFRRKESLCENERRCDEAKVIGI